MSRFCDYTEEERREYLDQFDIPQEIKDYLLDHIIDVATSIYYACDNNLVLDTEEAFIVNYLIEENKYILFARIDKYIINHEPEYLLTGYEFDQSEIDKYFNDCKYGLIYKRNERIEKILK